MIKLGMNFFQTSIYSSISDVEKLQRNITKAAFISVERSEQIVSKSETFCKKA